MKFNFRLTKERNFNVFGPLYKALLNKNKTSIHGNKFNFSELGISYNYIITHPTYIHTTKVTSFVGEVTSTLELENTTMSKSINMSSVVYCPDDISGNLRKYI